MKVKMGSPKYHSSSAFKNNREDDIRKQDRHPYFFFNCLPSTSSATPTHFHLLCLITLLFLPLLFTLLSYSDSASLVAYLSTTHGIMQQTRYLYWGHRVDCPGKLCDKCSGLGHQESSLRCALEEAMVLHRTFVMPSRMCINQQHNDKSLLHASSKSGRFESWGAKSCSMDSLYDLDLISQTVRVILDTSNEWQQVLSKADPARTVVNVKGVSRAELLLNPYYREAMVINHTASELSWLIYNKNKSHLISGTATAADCCYLLPLPFCAPQEIPSHLISGTSTAATCCQVVDVDSNSLKGISFVGCVYQVALSGWFFSSSMD